MVLCLRDFRRASFTPTQVASAVATAPRRATLCPDGAVVDADAAGVSCSKGLGAAAERVYGNGLRGGVT